MDLDKGSLPSVITLGVLWLAEEDVFPYKVNPPENDYPLTKRNFLRKVAMLFDPIGFLTPYVIRAKILLQEMWTSGLDWDDPLGQSQARTAKMWFEELRELTDVKVPRCLQLNCNVGAVTLHTFTDASGKAYGAATYTRYQYKDGTISTRLIASNTRVAPLSATSIPRLYLMANRVGEIHDSSSPSQWRYVRTRENPADLPTRCVAAAELALSEMWWRGPTFLREEEED